MAYGFRRTKIAYQLGWLSAIGAFVYKVLNVLGSDKIVHATGIKPLHLVEASVIFFLISIASAQYASTYLRHELPKYESEHRRAA